jgi:hypothetical protein
VELVIQARWVMLTVSETVALVSVMVWSTVTSPSAEVAKNSKTTELSVSLGRAVLVGLPAEQRAGSRKREVAGQSPVRPLLLPAACCLCFAPCDLFPAEGQVGECEG